MILGIEKELFVFLQALLCGNFVYLIYSAVNVFRQIVRHNLLWTSVEDIVYWIGTGFYLFLKIYHVTNGIIRWYFIIGTLIGAWITHRTIGKFTKKHIAKCKKRE